MRREILKKLWNNFITILEGFFGLEGGGQGEIENQISQRPLEVPQNSFSNI